MSIKLPATLVVFQLSSLLWALARAADLHSNIFKLITSSDNIREHTIKEKDTFPSKVCTSVQVDIHHELDQLNLVVRRP